MKNKVVNYDGYDYDYTQYWKNRQYENNAEHLVLEKLLKDESGEWFIDIGGSYGRLTDTYASKFKNCIVLDYSLKTLQKNNDLVTNKFPNTTFVAANAYKMPFRDNSFDGGVMVRVLHHIERQKEYFSELSRVLKDDSIYIQEFANKLHLKARIRAFLKNDKEIFSKEPSQQPTICMEGSRNGDVSFLNFHPGYINDIMKEYHFDIEKRQGSCYLRIPLLKKIFGAKILTFFEKILQSLIPNSKTPPSIFLKTELEKEDESEATIKTIHDILVCPICKNNLVFENEKATCQNCHKEYFKKEQIWDLRVE